MLGTRLGALGCSAVPFAFRSLGLVAGFALIPVAVDGANGGDFELRSLGVRQPDLPSQCVGRILDRAGHDFADQDFTGSQAKPWGVAVAPGCDTPGRIGQAAEMVGEHAQDGFGSSVWFQLDTGTIGVIKPSR